jgi:hypothetical protein
MNKSVRIRYVGVQAVDGSREYEFSVEEPEPHRVVLVIHHSSFCGQLTFQEAPGLCYEKLCAEIDRAGHTLFAATIEITADDCARYRENHRPAGKGRAGSSTRHLSPRPASLDIGASSLRRRLSTDH